MPFGLRCKVSRPIEWWFLRPIVLFYDVKIERISDGSDPDQSLILCEYLHFADIAFALILDEYTP